MLALVFGETRQSVGLALYVGQHARLSDPTGHTPFRQRLLGTPLTLTLKRPKGSAPVLSLYEKRALFVRPLNRRPTHASRHTTSRKGFGVVLDPGALAISAALFFERKRH